MSHDLHLNLMYNFLPAGFENNTKSYYKVLYFFSEAGVVSKQIIDSIYENYESSGPSSWICFENLDDLGMFALEVCKKMEAPEVLILSAQDYNLAIDACSDLRAFREVFRRYGTCLDNPEKVRKKNVFSKLFN